MIIYSKCDVSANCYRLGWSDFCGLLFLIIYSECDLLQVILLRSSAMIPFYWFSYEGGLCVSLVVFRVWVFSFWVCFDAGLWVLWSRVFWCKFSLLWGYFVLGFVSMYVLIFGVKSHDCLSKPKKSRWWCIPNHQFDYVFNYYYMIHFGIAQ